MEPILQYPELRNQIKLNEYIELEKVNQKLLIEENQSDSMGSLRYIQRDPNPAPIRRVIIN